MTVVMEPNPMPGTFLPDNDFSFRCAKFKASPFLPPDRDTSNTTTTSSSSSSFSQNSQQGWRQSETNTSRFSDDQRYSRKRPRLNTGSLQDASHNRSSSAHGDVSSPSPLVNTDYRIAGGLDTPTASRTQHEEDGHEFDYEIDCRPSRYSSQNSSHTTDSYFPKTTAPDRSRKNKRRLSPPSPPMKGWGKTVWAFTGGFAGKVINFCWNTTFSGFYAGGGGGYKFDTGTTGPASSTWADVGTKGDGYGDGYSSCSRKMDQETTPLPGGFPDEGPEFIEDYMSKLTVDHEEHSDVTPSRGRRDEVPAISRYNSWVFVEDSHGTSRSRESSPVRKKSRASTANLYAARPSNVPRHPSHTLCRPCLTPRSSTARSSASYASPRNSISSVSTTKHQPHHAIASFPTTDLQEDSGKRQSTRPSSRHSNRASLASPRRQSSVSPTSPSQKQSPEVRKFEQKMRKKEAKQDQTMNRFNYRLQAMIREGQAALGSRVEVEMGDEDVDLDEGYYEDRDVKGGIRAWGTEDARPWPRS
ncbi:hypothetical protein CLCR_08421 [Cladophialophora carrionii]|uniref:Uncharacterized protein n=1 Tax=Cladophialophora carrionii TaxID=86049 RepID=A0A1C1CSK2_9EURO|nr:hypothetical protein CLCR_08421 [Cladophialophora carrionii]